MMFCEQKGENCLHYAVQAGGVDAVRYLVNCAGFSSMTSCMNEKLERYIDSWNPVRYRNPPPTIALSQQVLVLETLFELKLADTVSVVLVCPTLYTCF